MLQKFVLGYIRLRTDDMEHHGKGIKDLVAIMHELGLGSIATGIGFAWAKVTAFASDCDETIHL